MFASRTTPSAPARSAAEAASASAAGAISEMPSPSEIAWLKRRWPIMDGAW
jgi:hypothetical protein